MTPGPNEPKGERLNHYLNIQVDDLLYLYDHGIKICTPSCPQGNFVIPFSFAICSNTYVFVRTYRASCFARDYL